MGHIEVGFFLPNHNLDLGYIICQGKMTTSCLAYCFRAMVVPKIGSHRKPCAYQGQAKVNLLHGRVRFQNAVRGAIM